MIYCVSDIHGRIDLFEKLLETINFSNNDTIYVLGDSIDRGGGFAVLEKIIELQEKGQAKFIQGNHEINFVSNVSKLNNSVVSELYYGDLFFESKRRRNQVSFSDEYKHMVKQQELFQQFRDSVNAATNLTQYESYLSCEEYFNNYELEERKKVIDFISSAPAYVDIEVNNRNYRLLHAGCEVDGTVSLDVREEFYKNPSPLENTTIIFGHTTTKDIRMQINGVYTQPSIWYDDKNNNDKIGIDCGCCFAGGKLACLRLDDMKEFYVDNDKLTTFPFSKLNDYFYNNQYSMSKLKEDIWSL